MSWTPFVRTEYSEFPSSLFFEEESDARASAESQASRLRSLHLKIVDVMAVPSSMPANYVLRDHVLVKIVR